jgi:hypothetical protein
MANDEELKVASVRLTHGETAHAQQLGGGSVSAGIRRSLRLSYQQAGAQGSARLAALLEQIVPADVITTPSGAGWMPDPSADLILQFRRMAPGAVLAMPNGLMAWGIGESGSDCSLSIDVAADLVAICDLARDSDAVAPLDGVAGVAALVDLLSQVHHLARLSAATGTPVGGAMAACSAMRMRVKPVDADGLAVIELAGASIRLNALAFLQMQAEATALLSRLVAQSVSDRQQLEHLLQHRPIAGVRSHGEG